MFGKIIKDVVCPYCGEKHDIDLGVTNYYSVNGSEEDYTKCQCWSCDKKYWVTHFDKLETKKMDEHDIVRRTTCVCW